MQHPALGDDQCAGLYRHIYGIGVVAEHVRIVFSDMVPALCMSGHEPIMQRNSLAVRSGDHTKTTVLDAGVHQVVRQK